MHTFLLDVPRAAVIWVVLVVLAVLALAGLVAAGPRPPRPPRRSRRSRRRAAPDTAVLELTRYASEVGVAADRAAETARRARAAWLSIQDESEAAWRSLDAADAESRRLERTVGLPTPHTPRTPTEYADRERYLHRAAMIACAHSELSVVELSRVLAHRGGWDPRLHPVEQEVLIRRAIRDGLRTAERAVADRERAAWREAELTASAAASLRAEALLAAERASALRPQAAATVRPAARVRPAASPRPVAAARRGDTLRGPDMLEACRTARAARPVSTSSRAPTYRPAFRRVRPHTRRSTWPSPIPRSSAAGTRRPMCSSCWPRVTSRAWRGSATPSRWPATGSSGSSSRISGTA